MFRKAFERGVSAIARNTPGRGEPRRRAHDAAVSGGGVSGSRGQAAATPLAGEQASRGQHSAAVTEPQPETKMFRGHETTFPCMMKKSLQGPDPTYQKVVSGFKLFQSDEPFHCELNGGVLPELDVAYETWGRLNEARSNAVIIHTGLSANSHARSHEENPAPGWWEKFIGPGCAIDTNHFFVICANNIGGCYGSSGPSSKNPLTDQPYATTFPIITVADMVNSQFMLLDHLGIQKLHASVGPSLGGMISLMAGALYPDRVGRVVSISACAQSHPASIAMRYLQRRCIMQDPHWNNGYYYDGKYPGQGMKMAREIATTTYRSGPEWEIRFSRKKISGNISLCPTFEIESYIDYQGAQFMSKYDPNSLLYISKAMDLFDISDGYSSMVEGLQRVRCPIMVMGVQSDILFPVWQQRELAKLLHQAGNEAVTYFELNSIFGHDTFLLDLNGVGTAIKGFLETAVKENGNGGKKQNKTHHFL
ncbi:serine O-succinyltransferase-like isoform X2 [Branchiostoma floridae]|uniref:Serine O-succinyltransferase-like isoform X1 n=1 Tax=Branchiostoma floridae TaxID=7739 RepID=A0A9J7MZ32_BRAFL|nr:serine O-succinyltransferase-like isoform X1 [Branchiostoma floridae]XP_035684004.1 serine O-succinyltransferase-like isoform X2 [Branchiostoma floridae]